MRRLFRLIACGLFAATTAPAAAAAAAGEPVALQLEVVAVQLEPARTRPIKAYFTIYLELRDAAHVTEICSQIRSFHEAATITAGHFKEKDADFTIEAVEKQIASRIRSKFQNRNISKIYVVAQNKRPGEGSKITLLPGSTGRCMSLVRIPLDVLARNRASDDGKLIGYDPRLMLDDAYPLAVPGSGLPMPLAEDASNGWLALTIVIAATLAVSGAAGALYERRRRGRREEQSLDRRKTEDRRSQNRPPSGGAEKRGQDSRRSGAERRAGNDRRNPKGAR